jgi:hypothetical protein
MSEHHDASMRTTVTLENDLARKLKALAARRGLPFKQVLNEVIRRGLSGQEPAPSKPARYVVVPQPGGLAAGIDPDRLNQLLDELEIEDFLRESSR